MNVAFAGTPAFARAALECLLAARFDVRLVLTQPDRPAGRGLHLQASEVKACAVEHAIRIAQPRSLRLDGKFPGDAEAARDALSTLHPDVIVVAAYGLLLPRWVLELPRLGCINIHASLLPRWRGAAPIQRTIEAGDAQTGITVMQMDEGLDTGPMLTAEALPIGADDTTATLQARLAALGGELIVRVLRDLAGGARPVTAPQPDEGVTYARKVTKDEAAIDWRLSAAAIERRLRAFDPFPGATATLHGEVVKCWRGRVVDGSGTPGEILAIDDEAIRVACGADALELTQLQRPGGRRLTAREYLQRSPLRPGMSFAVAPV